MAAFMQYKTKGELTRLFPVAQSCASAHQSVNYHLHNTKKLQIQSECLSKSSNLSEKHLSLTHFSTHHQQHVLLLSSSAQKQTQILRGAGSEPTTARGNIMTIIQLVFSAASDASHTISMLSAVPSRDCTCARSRKVALTALVVVFASLSPHSYERFLKWIKIQHALFEFWRIRKCKSGN